MLEEFKSKHFNFLNLSVALCLKCLCALLGVLRGCSHFWIIFPFFFNLSAV